MLKPVKMVKIRVIGLNMYKSTIIDDMHDLNVIQIENTDQEVAKIFNVPNLNTKYKMLADNLSKFKGFLSILPERPVKEKKYFSSQEELLDSISKIPIAGELSKLKDDEDKYNSIIRESQTVLKPLEIISGFREDLSILNNDYVESFIIESDQENNNLRTDYSVFTDMGNGYSIVTINRKNEPEFLSLLSSKTYGIMKVPELNGKVKDNIESQNKIITDTEGYLNGITSSLNALSDKYYETIAQITEQLEIYVKEEEILSNIASSENAFAMEGWIPASEYENVSNILNKDSNNTVMIRAIETKEDPPTKLSNPKHFKIFEFFIRFYSLPEEYEFDPTLIFALVFPVFFGLMVGDAGYGLAILLVSLFIIHRIDHPPAKSHIPRKISRFVLMIMGKNSLKTLAKALIPSSIIAIIFGIVFNEFFGFTIYPVPFQISPTPVPVTHIGLLLVISGYIGLAFVTFGFVLGIINNMYINHRKAAIAKIGWILMAWSFAILGLNLIHRISLSPTEFSSLIGYVMLIVGFVMVIVFEGTLSLMEIPSIISHVLSYTRIVGILLASVVLALVINTVFRATLSDPFYFIILGVIILVVGQLFNLLIAVFEPGIQGARLLYVEFFSKFYFGNGKQFSPFGSNRRFTLKKFDKK
jgi:V/A-type H+-transporting ATPase subunit I